MNNLKDYITEKFKLSTKNTKRIKYKYFPKNKKDLVFIIKDKYNDLKDKNEVLDLNDIDISKINNLSYLFEEIKPIKVNMNNWDVSHVIDIHGLFWNNEVTEEIHIEDWDVSNVESVYGAFYFCTNVKKLNLDKWDLKSCTEFDLMFKGCENLDTHFTDNWKMPNHQITTGSMFEGCKYKPKWYNE